MFHSLPLAQVNTRNLSLPSQNPWCVVIWLGDMLFSIFLQRPLETWARVARLCWIGYGLHDERIGAQCLAGTRYVLLLSVHMGCGAHPTVGGGSFLAVKADGARSCSIRTGAKFKKAWSYTSTPPGSCHGVVLNWTGGTTWPFRYEECHEPNMSALRHCKHCPANDLGDRRSWREGGNLGEGLLSRA